MKKTLVPVLVLSVMALLPVMAAPDAALIEKRDKLLIEYTDAREVLGEIARPQRNDPDFRKKLGVWSVAVQRHKKAAHDLFPVLAEVAATARDDEYKMMELELRKIHGDLFDDRTQAGHDALSFFSKSILPLVRDKKLAPERAALYAELTKPDEWVREYDKATGRGQLAEPTGWAIQDTHSLALARAGKIKEARRESDLLLKKTELIIKKGRLPHLGMYHHGEERAKKSLQREFILHRALIEVLAGNAANAKLKLKEAQAIEEPNAEVEKSHMALEKNISGLIEHK